MSKETMHKPVGVSDFVYVARDEVGYMLTLNNLDITDGTTVPRAMLFANDEDQMQKVIETYRYNGYKFVPRRITFGELYESCLYNGISLLYDGREYFNLDPRTLN